ncbi:ccr4-not transcription complex subunit 2 [Anaeramoeba flamelloides]|uniref:Ccr4-not transcription complex subunit 2 n=1 Tax=Anaeramoeba flamelloides TaxID=1746091 RepID=A0ABQ8X6P6_9EUKA|nr:ccr4-not transcription complex subunit 2 [Anaeramoeba flamelloides]
MYPNKPYNSMDYKGNYYGQMSYNPMNQPKETRDLSFRQTYYPSNEDYYNYSYQSPQNNDYQNYYSNSTETHNETIENEMYGDMGTGQQMYNENQLVGNNDLKGNEYSSYYYDEYSNSQGLEMNYGQQERSSFPNFTGNNPEKQTNTLNIQNPKVNKNGGYLNQQQQKQKQIKNNNSINYGNTNQIQEQYLQMGTRTKNRNMDNNNLQNTFLKNVNQGLSKQNEGEKQTSESILLFEYQNKTNYIQSQNKKKQDFSTFPIERGALVGNSNENENQFVKKHNPNKFNLKERINNDRTHFKGRNPVVLNANDNENENENLAFIFKDGKILNSSTSIQKIKEQPKYFNLKNTNEKFKNINNYTNIHTNKKGLKGISSSFSNSNGNNNNNQLLNHNYNSSGSTTPTTINNNHNHNNNNNNSTTSVTINDSNSNNNNPFQINKEEFSSLSQVVGNKNKSNINNGQKQFQIPTIKTFKKSPGKKERGEKLKIIGSFEDENNTGERFVNNLNLLNIRNNNQNNRYQDKKNNYENNVNNNKKRKKSNNKNKNNKNTNNKNSHNNVNHKNKNKRAQQQQKAKEQNNNYTVSKLNDKKKNNINETKNINENKQESDYTELWNIVESNERKENFLLSGLIKSIKTTGPTFNTLTFGIDLRTLGLDLNTTDKLCSIFESPWGVPENRENVEHEIPDFYSTNSQVELSYEKMSNFSDLLLLYIFYSSPRDTLQIAAVEILLQRGWSFHKEHAVWIIKDPESKNGNSESGSFIFFNPDTWEMVREENFILRKEEVL